MAKQNAEMGRTLVDGRGRDSIVAVCIEILACPLNGGLAG